MILLTRPIRESLELKEKFNLLGMESIIEPMIQIEEINGWKDSYHKLNKNKDSLLIFTSINAIYEFASKEKSRDNEIAVVGKASKEIAIKLGFKNILVGEGDAISLYKLIAQKDKKTNIIYFSGEIITLDMPLELTKQGFQTTKIQIYKTINIDNFSQNTLTLFKKNKIKSVLLFSSETAKNFMKIIFHNNLDLSNTKLFALSEKIAKVVEELDWCKVYISSKKDSEHIIKLIEKHV